ncbi:MAG: pyridoxal phosphate-dependent aminotransferase [Proteobacteria bacterium]|nr:pyridoxal phosphate-dependent aminotransferase [Pseudomonadota bacterium]
MNPHLTLRRSIAAVRMSATLDVNQQVVAARQAGQDVLHLGFGQSPFPVHETIQRSLGQHADKNMYLPSAGLAPLRSAALDYFSARLGFAADGYTCMVGSGSKELIFAVQLAVAGDLLMPVPSWVSYAPQVIMTDDRVIKVPTADSRHIAAEQLDRTIAAARREGKHPTKLILNYPNNPTGLSLDTTALEEIAAVCRTHGLVVISDEIYGLVDFRGNHRSIAAFYPENTVITTGLSKHLSLGGYRIGFAMVPTAQPALFDALLCIASEIWSAVSAPAQYAAVSACSGHRELEQYIASCTAIHQLITAYVRDRLSSFGVAYPALHGAFYLYPDFAPFREALAERGVTTSDQLAADLLTTARVATLPGTAFGDEPETLTLRLATCDFNGQSALAYYHAHPDCTAQALVHACCDEIRRACDCMEAYFTRPTSIA